MAESSNTEHFSNIGSLLGGLLGNITVESYDQREPDGKIQTQFRITSKSSSGIVYGSEVSSSDSELDTMRAVLAHISNIIGHEINVTAKPKEKYIIVKKSKDPYTFLPLSEFLTYTPVDSFPLFEIDNERLGRYLIFDPMPKGGARKGVSELSDWIYEAKPKPDSETNEPCLAYDHNGAYGEHGILGRRINERIILPVIFNAKVETDRSMSDRQFSANDICYISPNSEDEIINSVIQADSYWFIVHAPGEYVDWHALNNYYRISKNGA